jgi:hypothetical protein
MLKQINHILISGFIIFLLSSCTVINIKNADLVKTQLYPGFVIIQVVNAINNVAINSRGVGTYLNGEGITFGYFHDQRVYVNDLSKCITVFFEEQTEPLVCKTK